MGNKLYVGNLPRSATERALIEMFSRWGDVRCVDVQQDAGADRCRGTAWVEMSTEAQAREAAGRLHGANYEGHSMIVSVGQAARSGRPD